ncbi:MAG: LamG-like jellyroll fold domain-containing protein [bacterium]
MNTCLYPGAGLRAVRSLTLVACMAMVHAASASTPARDDACNDPPYSDAEAWDGLNGGTGFAPWEVIPAVNNETSGSFIGDANENGGGGGPGINCPAGRAWGLYANSGAEVTAMRLFTGGGLIAGQRFSIDMDNGYIDGLDDTNNVAELLLLNADGEMRFGFHFRGGASEYEVFDASSEHFDRGTGVPFTDGGLHLAFTPGSEDTYTLQIVRLATASTTTLTGVLGGPAGTALDRLLLVHRNARAGSGSDTFFNNLVISCNGQPSAPTAGSDSPRCEGQDLHLTAGGVAGGEYRWTGPDGFTSSQQHPTVYGVTTANAGTYAVNVTVNGCVSATASTTVTVLPAPAQPAPSNDGPVCAGGVLHLFANTTADTYTWTGPDGFTSSEQNPTLVGVTAANAGSYNLVVSVNDCTSPMGSTTVSVTPAGVTWPPDIAIECGTSLDPTNTGTAAFTSACDAAPTITYADSVDEGECPLIGIVVRSWTAKYAGGFTTHGIQTITIVDTQAPALNGVPADATVECSEVPLPAGVTAEDAGGFAQGIPTLGLVLHYSFDTDGGATVVDATGHGNNGVVSNAVFTDNGYRGGAYFFDSRGDFIRVPNAPGLNTPKFTMTAWVKALDTGTPAAPRGLLGKHQACYDEQSYWIYMDGMNLKALMWGTGTPGPISDSAPSFVGRWRMVTMTFDGAQQRLYVDDKFVGQRTIAGYTGNSKDLLIGAGEYTFDDYDGSGGQPSQWWYGYIDEVRAYDRALSSNEVSHLYVGQTGNAAFTERMQGDCPRVITRTWTAVDACGNSATATQVLQIVDTTAPVLAHVPPDMTVQCEDGVPPPALVTATDNCSAMIKPVLTETESIEDYVEVIRRTWTATDACGNSTTAVQVITVHDTTPPVLVGVPADVTVDAGAVPAPADVTAVDDCGFGRDLPPGNGLVLYYSFDADHGAIVPDESGNGHTGHVTHATFTEDGHRGGAYFFDGDGAFITVSNSMWLRAPQFTVSAWARSLDTNVTVEARGLLGKHQSGYNLDSFWISQNASGLNAYLWGDDAAGWINTPAAPTIDQWALITMSYDGTNQRFYVNGNLAGQLEVPGYVGGNRNLLIGAGEYAFVTGEPNWWWHGYIDDVRIYERALTPEEVENLYEDTQARSESIAVMFSETTNTTYPEVITRTWTATDEGGNSVYGTQRVTVLRQTPPELSGQGEDATIACPATPVFTAPTATGGCDDQPVLSFTDVAVPGECAGSYRVTRTWTAVDSCGNVSEPVSQTITVIDTTPPEIVVHAPMDITVECNSVPSPALATAIDNCEGSVTISMFESPAPGSCPGTYTISRIYTAADSCGNSASVTQVITVIDTIPPVLSGQGEDATIECPASPVFTAPTAMDNCDKTPSIAFTDVTIPGAGAVSYSVIRTWTATDSCGNQSAPVSQTITVVDTTAPVITCPDSQTVVQPSCTGGVVFVQPTATDLCDTDVTITCVPPPGSPLGPGSHTITCTAVDDCSNVSTCSFTVYVLPRLHVVFDPSPVNDDNVDDNIETDQDILNKFKIGSRVPHKVKLYDCAGNDVTLALASQVTVKLNVTEREYVDATTSVLINDVPENYTGVGSAGGVMVITGGFFHYNLNTTGYPAGTVDSLKFFRSHVTVEYDTAPCTIAGEEDALLESK